MEFESRYISNSMLNKIVLTNIEVQDKLLNEFSDEA